MNSSISNELELSRLWAAHRLPPDLRLVDGGRIHVVYPGVWSNSDGPDFKQAMISIDGRLCRGDVELHIRASDWYRHQHQHDPAYNTVVLHVVHLDDASQGVKTANGNRLRTLELSGRLGLSWQSIDDQTGDILARLGTRTCLPTVGVEKPDLVRAVIRERGWRRFVEKQLRFCQELQHLPASEVLYRGMLEALGYSANRSGMVEVGERLPYQLVARFVEERGYTGALAALLGVAGLLQAAQSNSQIERSTRDFALLFRDWEEIRLAYRFEALKSQRWTLNRVRPSNHPAVRLASMAALIAGAAPSTLFERLLELELDGGQSWDHWLSQIYPSIGKPRRQQILTNIFAPFLAAYAEVTRDTRLAEDVSAEWEQLPGSVNDRISRLTRTQIVGDIRFPIRLALEEQGLHAIYREGCSELRCFECPIARLAVEHESLVRRSRIGSE